MGYWVCPRCGSNDAYEGNSLVSVSKQSGAVLVDTDFGMVGRTVGGGSETKNIRVVKCRDCGELLNEESDYFLDEKEIREAEREERHRAKEERVDDLAFWTWMFIFSPAAYFTWINLSGFGLLIALVVECFGFWFLAYSFVCALSNRSRSDSGSLSLFFGFLCFFPVFRIASPYLAKIIFPESVPEWAHHTHLVETWGWLDNVVTRSPNFMWVLYVLAAIALIFTVTTFYYNWGRSWREGIKRAIFGLVLTLSSLYGWHWAKATTPEKLGISESERITGIRLWSTLLESPTAPSPAIGSDGTVYVGAGDKLYALNGISGEKLWEFETGGDVASSPAIGPDGMVYVGSRYSRIVGNNNLYALNGKSGEKLWEFDTGDNVSSSPAIGSDGTVYIGARDTSLYEYSELYALNGKSGEKLWRFGTGGSFVSSPAIGPDGTVYVTGGSYRSGKLYALNGKSGTKIWEFETEKGFKSPAIGSDGTIYLGADDDRLYALNGKSGEKLWEFETSWDVESSPAISSDGTVYFVDYAIIYALKTPSKGPAKSPWPMFGQNAQRTGQVLKK